MSLVEFESPFHAVHTEEVANKLAMKMDLSMFISDCIRALRMTQTEAAQKLGVTQSRVSELANGKLEKFTIDAMMDMLDRLGFKASLVLPEADATRGLKVAVAPVA